MVGRTEPLVINIFVAAFARIGFHEELAGNFLFPVNLRRTGEEIAFRAITLAIHAFGRHLGILYSVARLPTLSKVVRAITDDGKGSQAERHPDSSGHNFRSRTGFPSAASAPPVRHQQTQSRDRKSVV